MNLNTALKEKDGFSENEARIADYILSHKDAVLQMPIQKLARETYTSTSAIMRLCAKLQTSGYRQFKILYAQQLAERGYITLAFDPSFTGESGGEPRYMNSPDINVEDFQAAVDYLVSRDDVDADKIGISTSTFTKM